MKTTAVLAASLVVILTVGVAAIEFAGGYSAFPLILPFTLLPAAALPLALAFLAAFWAIVGGIRALRRGDSRSIAFVAILLCLSWFILRCIAGPAFLNGLAARLHRCSSPGEIEEAARSCLSLMPQGGYTYGPESGKGAPAAKALEIRRIWDNINRYSFVHLAHGCAVVVRPPAVNFEWGSALTGHWGIQFVSAPGGGQPPYYRRFSDNILLFQDD